jgi:hypothetical protein
LVQEDQLAKRVMPDLQDLLDLLDLQDLLDLPARQDRRARLLHHQR